MICAYHKKAALKAAFLQLLIVFVFTFLICNTATRLASRLAGSLAFAATALLGTVAKILRGQSFNALHNEISLPISEIVLIY